MLTPEEFENRSRLKRVGFYLTMLVAAGVALAIMIYVIQMQLLGWSVGGSPFNTTRSLPTPVQLVLYRSPATTRYWASVGGNADVLIKPWQDFARLNGVSIKETTSLDGINPTAGDVLVLPSSVALDEQEKAALLSYRDRGGSILATWAPGSRDGQGQWVGWTFLHDLAAVSVVAELAAQAGPDIMVVRGQMPVAHRLPAGRQVSLGKTTERPFVLAGAGIAAEGERPLAGAPIESGLLAFHEPDAPAQGALPGRVVAWGVAETTWEYQPHDMQILLGDMLQWLTRQPAVVTANWPDGKPAAHAVVVDGLGNADMAVRWAQQLNAATHPTSLFLPGNASAVDAQALRSQLAVLDVGYRGLPPSAGVDAAAQVKALVGGVAETVGSAAVLPGYLPPGDQPDPTTDKLLYDAGVRYRVGVQADAAAGLPFFQAVAGEKPGQRYVVLPREVPGREAFSGYFSALRARGNLGLAVLSAADHGASAPAVQALTNLLNDHDTALPIIWRATATDVARWWNEKERFQISVRPAGARLEVDVSVVGQGAFTGGALVVMLPRKGLLPEIRSLKTGLPMPELELLDEYRALVRFGTLAAGNYSYQFTF